MIPALLCLAFLVGFGLGCHSIRDDKPKLTIAKKATVRKRKAVVAKKADEAPEEDFDDRWENVAKKQ